ncbi:hypothetical protein C8E03_101652 [Lachnotalea glycerini]|uniref:LiaI-LiaF-like transmembrane region domain-containing protein n=1 Tax=Lachnotalea glycerini TaxID=1763509 RepID=A0A255IIZ0_9FIRM|nr:DUF5668 domain-containing protein [Lachnotalea glycerini]PXV96019.1 hypothetical protein C8E03_101652 [Lachnotalea glycerini]RDY30197.1 hypothetical protein CG710_016000 [Lachnotalea glycerini]
MRVHKVGTITLGIVLVVFGLLFLAHMLIPSFHYELIFKLWPIILIILGLEVLLVNAKSRNETFIYDKGAIFLIIIISFFSMSMATMELLFQFYR